MTHRIISTALSGLVCLGLCASLAGAEEEKKVEAKPEVAEKKAVKPAAGKTPKKVPSKKPDTYLAIVGGDVYTVTGPVYRRGTVLIKNDKIVAVGSRVHVPPAATRIVARGLRVLPGFVSVKGSFGVRGGVKLSDSLDPFDRNIPLGLSAGITTSYSTPGGFGFFGYLRGVRFGSGQLLDIRNVIIKLTPGKLDGMLVKEPAAVVMSLWGKNYAQARMIFSRARAYLATLRKYDEEVEAGKPAKRPPLLKALAIPVQILRGAIVVRAGASRIQQIRHVVALAEEFGFRVAIDGCEEGWLIPGEVARAKAMAIVNPRSTIHPSRTNPRTGSHIENAQRLTRSGVPVAVTSPTGGIMLWGIAGQDLLTLPLDAAFAMRGGLSEKDALASITINAARVLGIEDRVGSLEPGKDGDVILLSGDPFDYKTFCELAVINGKIVFERARFRMLGHIRPVKIEVIAPKKEAVTGKMDKKGEKKKGA